MNEQQDFFAKLTDSCRLMFTVTNFLAIKLLSNEDLENLRKILNNIEYERDGGKKMANDNIDMILEVKKLRSEGIDE